MKHYISDNNTVFAFASDGSEDAFIPAGLKPISAVDLVALLAPTLAEKQKSQIALMSAACEAQIVAGFTSAALGPVHTYPGKVTDQQNLTASVVGSLMPNLPVDWLTPFWCANDQGVWSYSMHSSLQIQQVGLDCKAAILLALTKNATLSAQILSAVTPAAVTAIVW